MSKILRTEDIAEMLRTTTAAVRCHISRQKWDVVPKPFKLGRKWAWLSEDVNNWLNDQKNQGGKNYEV
ncbi:conserved hypothetical protein [Desulfonatronospira thiodismutans ASO3-1]|uniref:Helix-turn-helix domain-containing protein n=1 Tax=Desulfonatronospira thiodismutans ASO3-1 TaxID=555779 RepID=D6SV19_9BACT|nr:helix-turn-helix domain-containing protein [Desulfonatronospira thiodismutans]EFI32775.1 conserved hypothetical protein [Desulfonatronospira thiodismutans ASO3-1]